MASKFRVVFLGIMALAAAAPLAGTARAGGSPDLGTGDADDPRTTVFGFVKDKSGDPVGDAKVTITMKLLKTDLVVQSDQQGHFSAKLLYNPVAAKDVALACAKDGYYEMTVVLRPPLGVDAPIEFDCVLDRT